jgi:hypothetical protein
LRTFEPSGWVSPNWLMKPWFAMIEPDMVS